MVDAEALVRLFLAQTSGVRVVTRRPADLADRTDNKYSAGILLVSRGGGGNRRRLLDAPLIQVDTLIPRRVNEAPNSSGTLDSARKLAERVRDLMLFSLPGQVINGGVVADVTCPVGPRQLNDADSFIERVVSNYEVFLTAA